MKRLLLMIDLHVIVVGIAVPMLLVGTVSFITFVPGTPRLLPCLVMGLVPLLVCLEPSIITRAIDRKKICGDAWRYFGVNTLIAMLYGVTCGLLIFGLLPRA